MFSIKVSMVWSCNVLSVWKKGVLPRGYTGTCLCKKEKNVYQYHVPCLNIYMILVHIFFLQRKVPEFVTTRTTVKTTRTTSLRQLGPLFEDNSDHFLGQLGPNLMAIHPVPLNANWYSHRQKLTISFTNFFYLKHDFIQLYLFFRQIFSKFIYPKRQYISEHIK